MGSHADSGLTEDAVRRLRDVFVAVFRRSPAEIVPDLRLGSVTGWDSMNAITFTFELERVFDVELGETTFTADQTIADVLDTVRQRAAGQRG
jgi:acyl carrier protein